MLALARPVEVLVAEMVERRVRGIGDGPDRAAMAAVAAVRAALCDELLAAEGHAAVAAVAAFDVDFGRVDEHALPE